MRVVAVDFEKYKVNKVIKGVTGKYARQVVCLGGTKLYDLLQPLEPIVRRKKKEVTMADYLFGEIDAEDVQEVTGVATLTDLQNDKSICGIAVDLWDLHNGYAEVCDLGLPVFVYVDCKDMSVDEFLEHIEKLRVENSKVFYVCDVCFGLLDYKEVVETLDEKDKTTRIRLIGKTIMKLGGSSYGGMFPSWLAKKYKLDFDYNILHDTTQVAILAEEFDYLDMDATKVYAFNKVKEKV
jgi:hypothetical protein